MIVNNAVDLNNQAGQPADDPKPGPSTTAAEFDLEVFDSGSSCSLEDCWRCDKDCPPTVAPVVQGKKKKCPQHCPQDCPQDCLQDCPNNYL